MAMILTHAKQLAAQADEARQAASNEKDPSAKAWLQTIAAEYDRQAKLAAEREKAS